MKLQNINQVNEFLAAVQQAKGGVWLESPHGDVYNLKSKLSQYIAIGALLSEHGEDLELFCSNPGDEGLFFQFFANNPTLFS